MEVRLGGKTNWFILLSGGVEDQGVGVEAQKRTFFIPITIKGPTFDWVKGGAIGGGLDRVMPAFEPEAKAAAAGPLAIRGCV